MPNTPSDTVEDMEDDVEDHIDTARGALDAYVTENPVAALAISLGVGVFVGRFLL